MKLSKSIILGTIGAFMVSVASFADDGKGRPDFATLDADASGEISIEEFQAHAKARFDERDADGNGELTLEEIQAGNEGKSRGHGKRGEKFLEHFDADGNGSVSFEEMTAERDPAQHFEKLDADGSGGISEEELGAMRGKMHKFGRHGGDK